MIRDTHNLDQKLSALEEQSKFPCAYFETRKIDSQNSFSYYFTCPERIISFHRNDDLSQFFEDIQSTLADGYWLAGYFCFEFGYFFEPRLKEIVKTKRNDYPLAWFGVFDRPDIIDETKYLKFNQILSNSFFNSTDEPFKIGNLRLNIARDEYLQAVSKIKAYLKEGDTYQVNFTQKYKFSITADPLKFFRFLQGNQPVAYSAFINNGQHYLLSLSPELFFKKTGLTITSKPMKGTVKRGRYLAEDKELVKWLMNNPKNCAENIMIVDLIRNDLGKIADSGKVWVTDLYHTERFPKVHQMTSTVKATLKQEKTIEDIILAMFPCGSVTGVPKLRSMEIINELEKETRGIYTGAVGYISPDGDAQFNVAIRTLDIDQHGNGELGIGGGIVAESSDLEEYEECLLKATFLTEKYISFSLLETMRLEDGKIFLIDLHLQRLKDSADYFEIHYPDKEICAELDLICDKYADGRFKIRLLLHQNNQFDLQIDTIKETLHSQTWSIKISAKRINSADHWLFHKTTHRQLYNEERDKACQQGFDEVIFLNERDEVCEGAISNIFLSSAGKLTTPAKKSGLLCGTLRESLLNTNKCREKLILLDHLYQADKLFLGNSVVGLVEGYLAQPISKK